MFEIRFSEDSATEVFFLTEEWSRNSVYDGQEVHSLYFVTKSKSKYGYL